MIKAITLIVLSLFSFNTSATLSSQQIHAIQNGWHAPYSQETIDKILLPRVYDDPKHKFQVKFDIAQSGWQEPADDWMWALFWTLQVADIFSTYEGVKYDCVKEANPLLPEIPTISEMALLKGIVLLPTYEAIGYENITRADMVLPLIFTTLVVNNNLRVTDRAKRRCSLR